MIDCSSAFWPLLPTLMWKEYRFRIAITKCTVYKKNELKVIV